MLQKAGEKSNIPKSRPKTTKPATRAGFDTNLRGPDGPELYFY